jgi:hypothetical protein
VPYNPAWTDKDIRMYQHIQRSSGSKQIAAATVNTYLNRKARGRSGRRRRRRGR